MIYNILVQKCGFLYVCLWIFAKKKSGSLSQKLVEKKLSKSVSGFSKTKKKKKKKWHGPLIHQGRGKTLVVRPLKNVCVFFFVLTEVRQMLETTLIPLPLQQSTLVLSLLPLLYLLPCLEGGLVGTLLWFLLTVDCQVLRDTRGTRDWRSL